MNRIYTTEYHEPDLRIGLAHLENIGFDMVDINDIMNPIDCYGCPILQTFDAIIVLIERGNHFVVMTYHQHTPETRSWYQQVNTTIDNFHNALYMNNDRDVDTGLAKLLRNVYEKHYKDFRFFGVKAGNNAGRYALSLACELARLNHC